MASIPCSIHNEFSSCSASVASWSRPFSPSPPPPMELCSAGRTRTPLLGPIKTLEWLRNSSMARAEVGMGGGGGGARCWSNPRNGYLHAQIGLQFTSSSVRHQRFSKQVELSGKNPNFIVSSLVFSPMVRERASIKWSRPLSAMDGDKITSENSPPPSMNSRDVTLERANVDSVNTGGAVSDTQLSSSDVQPTVKKADKTTPETQEVTTKRTPLTAREKLRAARVLSKYTESRPPKAKPDLGSRVLDAIRETDGGKKRSGLPEAPSNLFDDSKRGLPKQGLTFNFPGGNDILIIAFSFVFISTVMFATTYIVWKAGAIHFNEY